MSIQPPNAFTSEFQRRLADLDEPATVHEAETAGSAQVVAAEDGFAVLLEFESLAEGDRPTALLAERAVALLVAAALPANGREPAFQLDPEAGERGFPLRSHGRLVGHFSRFDEGLLARLNSHDSLVRSPRDLALLLAAGGGLLIERVGRILERLTRPEPHVGREDTP